MLPIVLGLILISSIFGMVYLFQIASQQDAIKLYQKTSLPAIWKKISEIDIDFEISRAFEYTLYEIISEGGMMEPSKFVENVYSIFSKHVEKYPHTYNYELFLQPEPKNFASGKRAEMEVTLKVMLMGSEVQSVKIIKRNVSSDIRAQYLYEKAYMFYRYALEGKPIHCFKWDGDKKITVTVHSFGDDRAKVQLKWNLTQASYDSGSGGVHEKFENEFYEVFECELSNEQSCWVKLKLTGNKAVIYRWQSEIGELIPVLIEKNKPYSICIATRENVVEKINQTVEEKCRDDCLPRKATGSTSCNDCPNTYPSDDWALGRELNCMTSECTTDETTVKNCLKKNLREFIQYNILNDIITRENEYDNEVEWNITVSINSLSYSSTPGKNCPTSWTKVCDAYCSCPKKDKTGSVSTSPKIYTYTLFPLTKYYEKPLIWNFSYIAGGEATEESVEKSCSPGQSSSCSDYECSPGCTKFCVEKTLWQYKYSYSYDYTYTLTITIKDLKRNITLAG